MSKEVKVVAKRSDGQTFSYENADWGITKLEGIDFPPIEIFTQNRGFGNGAIVTGKRKGARDINIEAKSRNRSNNDMDRLRAIAFHNSNYTYDVEFTYLGQTKVAKKCELQGAKCPAENVYKRQTLTVSYLSADADLYADTSTATNFARTTPLWHVTRAYTLDGGTLVFGSLEHTITKIVNYLGSEPAPLYIKMEARGAVDGVIARIGDIQITVDYELSNGDVMIIDAANKIIMVNGDRIPEKLYNSLDLPKLQLMYGDNEVQVSAVDTGNLAFDSMISYTGRYGGL